MSLTSLAVGRSTFPLADCRACGKQALAWLDVDPHGDDVLRCLTCNAPVDTIARAGEKAVEALGYVFLDKKRKSPKAKKLSGCGAKGVRSCGSGGCSSGGGCSTGGGCSGGGCG